MIQFIFSRYNLTRLIIIIASSLRFTLWQWLKQILEFYLKLQLYYPTYFQNNINNTVLYILSAVLSFHIWDEVDVLSLCQTFLLHIRYMRKFPLEISFVDGLFIWQTDFYNIRNWIYVSRWRLFTPKSTVCEIYAFVHRHIS